jgi:hypothetical protein
MKIEQTECSETSAFKIQTPGNYPEENIQLYDTDSTASPTATFPDSVLISFTQDTEEKVS